MYSFHQVKLVIQGNDIYKVIDKSKFSWPKSARLSYHSEWDTHNPEVSDSVEVIKMKYELMLYIGSLTTVVLFFVYIDKKADHVRIIH